MAEVLCVEGILKTGKIQSSRELDTEVALEQTQTYIREYKTLAVAAKDASKITKEKLGVLKKDMAHLGKTDI